MVIDLIDLLVESIRVIKSLLTVDLKVNFLHDLVYFLIVFVSELLVESLSDILRTLTDFEHIKVVFGDDLIYKVILLVHFAHLSELFDDTNLFALLAVTLSLLNLILKLIFIVLMPLFLSHVLVKELFSLSL